MIRERRPRIYLTRDALSFGAAYKDFHDADDGLKYQG
jgi:hypothetical protein